MTVFIGYCVNYRQNYSSLKPKMNSSHAIIEDHRRWLFISFVSMKIYVLINTVSSRKTVVAEMHGYSQLLIQINGEREEIKQLKHNLQTEN